MTQLLLLGAVVVLVVATFWISTRLAMKAGSNVPFPSTPPPAAEGVVDNDLRAVPLVGLSIRTVLRNPGLLCFAAAITAISAIDFLLAPTPLRSWLLSGQSLSTMPKSSLSESAIRIASGGVAEFLSTWQRVAVATAVLILLRGGSWSFASVLGRLRERWRAITAFAALVVLSELPAAIAMELSHHHRIFSPVALILRAPPFFLGLGAAVLANENIGGLAATRRSAVFVLRAWSTRLWGQVLIVLPIVAIIACAGAMSFALAFGFSVMLGQSFTWPHGSSVILAFTIFMMALGIPLGTASAAFDAALYLRLAPSESSEAPSAPASPPIPSPA